MAEQLLAVELAQIDVRADPSALPFEAPVPNTVTTWRGRDVLWLGPDEWLIVGEPGIEQGVVAELADALAGGHASVLDVSANRAVFDLSDGLELLSSGCGLDLDPDRWLPRMCAQTLFGQAQVILHQLDRGATRVFVRPSFAGYLVDRLREAGPLTR